MAQFWRIGVLACLGLAGCGGRTLDGQWKGPVPGVALDGHIRFSGGRQVGAAFLGPPKIQASGKYEYQDDVLTITWDRILKDGEPISSPGASLKMKVEGSGNKMTLIPVDGGGSPVTWERSAN